MKPIRTAALIAMSITAFAFEASPANANWQFTSWGMTPEQVQQASGGTARPTTPDEKKAYTYSDQGIAAEETMPYTAGDLSFTAYFLFGARGLQGVSLKLNGGEAQSQELQHTLVDKYGTPPVRGSISAGWETKTDKIQITAIDGVTLTYFERRTTDSSGL